MSRPLRLMIAYGLQGLILLFVVGGLVYDVGGVRTKIANRFAHSITKTVERNNPGATPTSSRSHHKHNAKPGQASR